MQNQSLKQAINAVMSKSTYGLYDVQFKLLSGDGDWSYTPIHVNSVHLAQNFVGYFGDQLKVTIPMAACDYAKMFDHYQNLIGQLIIRFLDINGMPVDAPPLLVKKYYPVIDDQFDIRKSINDVSYRTTIDKDITITLVEPLLYNIRHMPIQGIFHDSTMAGIISHLAEGYKIPSVYIQTPDNIHTYDQVVIPPYREFKDVFHTLQERYGVYMLGLNNYFSNDTLYVWSPLDTNPVSPKVARLLKADSGDFAGSPSYHRSFDKGISIVINTDPQASDHSMISSEHIGSSIQFLRAASQVDGIVSQDPNGVRTYNQDTVVNVRLNENRLARQGSNKTIYAHQTDNMFALSAELARSQFVDLAFGWSQAKPWSLTPNMAIVYYSDENGKVGKRTGQIQKVGYELLRSDRGSVNTYTCQAVVGCRLSPSEQIVDNIS